MRGKATFSGVDQRLEGGWTVYSISDPNALTQVVGWLKFTCEAGVVLYRGQSQLYDDMTATGFRSLTENSHADYAEKLKDYISSIYGQDCACRHNKNFSSLHLCNEQSQFVKDNPNALVSGTYRAVVEPLLQHYGLKTRWLDVVDNIWIALWFACHQQITEGRYAHHRRRSIAQEGPDAKAYIAVFETGSIDPTSVPGYRVGPSTRFVDLRYAVPSVYLRPHAQHGALIAPSRLDSGGVPFGSMKEQVVGVVEIKLGDALEWLGTGAMTSGHVLFPPATRDHGYRRLLDWNSPPHEKLGHVTQFGPGN
ncbi:FRG domain-containing protein [Arthrobacter burdickii]|uniref:FRG domain-containing protein n=1 Tax=Arthrobacter burdickii TaxID=3035920 RepID=A0ABT8K4F6_9MICC|nr:FRG domain-containing protein [Arthrobacter burdickii]MDN4612320.1 FRG domain-containing protein [Arthrobacter burdickii]